MKFSKKFLVASTVVVIVFLLLFIWRFIQVASGELAQQVIGPSQKFYDITELKSQKDFKLLGDIFYIGGGFEPGWNFKITLIGNKFGVDLVSQYGDTKYVGYVDLASQSTSTKVLAGNLLDKDDKLQKFGMKIVSKKCVEPSGAEVDYTVNVLVGEEKLDGCAKISAQ
jgi:hypothetical protein